MVYLFYLFSQSFFSFFLSNKIPISQLIIGLLEEMQKVHIRTTEISGLPHFIRHVPFCGCFVVVVSVVVNSSANEEVFFFGFLVLVF